MFDKKCLDLAESFLSDYTVLDPTSTAWIAQRIQTGIDDDLSDLVSAGRIRHKDAPVPREHIQRVTPEPLPPPITGTLQLTLGSVEPGDEK